MTDIERLDAMVDIYHRTEMLRAISCENGYDGIHPTYATAVFVETDEGNGFMPYLAPAIQIFASKTKMQELADTIGTELKRESSCGGYYFFYKGLAFESLCD